LLSLIGDSLNLEGQVPVFISWNEMVAQLYTQTFGYLSSPLTARRPKVEVIEPGFARGYSIVKNKLRGL
jgi:hypothetical protein